MCMYIAKLSHYCTITKDSNCGFTAVLCVSHTQGILADLDDERRSAVKKEVQELGGAPPAFADLHLSAT